MYASSLESRNRELSIDDVPGIVVNSPNMSYGNEMAMISMLFSITMWSIC
jgi:hypothetical protein